MAGERLSPDDPASYSRPSECRICKLDLVWEIDFNKKIINGTVYLDAEKSSASVNRLILDTSMLDIRRVFCKESGTNLQFEVGEHHPIFGSKLEVKLPSDEKLKLTIGIDYSTSPESKALQWLTPEQTAGKRQPYLFSQCQAIHARSVVPCQDTPAVKFPYNAKVTVQKEVIALMSAIQTESSLCRSDTSKKVFSFQQKIPIPSYLIAIVVGDLESRDIGPRSKVWSEKEMVDLAAFEFSETERMLQTAESLLGPYVWQQYDLLVLPPSFPYGGMENPCLTFVTPTLLAGDRSLANVIAHEISHSWTGNLVTNSNHEHFWLNEGHTTFMERKICARLGSGEPLRHLLAMNGWRTLNDYVTLQGSDHLYTKLVPTLIGVDPDDAFSSVPYEKGFALLFYLEGLLGGPKVFEPFLRAYINEFRFRSINSNQWKSFLYSFFHDQVGTLNSVDWDAWFYSPGMPPINPQFDSTLTREVHQLSENWCATGEVDLGQFSPNDLANFSTPQKIEFLNELMLQEPFSTNKISNMERIYNMFSVKNSEIRFRWLRLCLRAEWVDAIPHAFEFINSQGRMKFVRPIYRDLYAWDRTRDQAVQNYQEHQHEMHSVTAGLLARDLELS